VTREALKAAEARCETWKKEAMQSIEKYGSVDKERYSLVMQQKEALDKKVEALGVELAAAEALVKRREADIDALRQVRPPEVACCQEVLLSSVYQILAVN
jgi:septum formation topological specificity factor MinE